MIPTALFVAAPRRYLEPVPAFDAEAIAANWRYRRDPLWGLWDVAHAPSEVMKYERGDCVDYARLAASWVFHHTERPLALYILGRVHNPPGHLVAVDGEHVYSTGHVYDLSIEEYAARTDRILGVRRGIRNADSFPRVLWRP